jgi:hypothetical protein
VVRFYGSLRVLALWLLSSSAESEAQVPDQVSIRWAGPASCPRPPTLDAEIARRLGRDASATQATAIEVEVRERSPSGYDLTLVVDAGAGRSVREVQLVDCTELHRAAFLLITTALAPEVAPAEEEEEEDDDEEETAREIAVHETRVWSLRAAAIGDLQALPAPTAGVALGGGFAGRNLRAWVEGRYLFKARSDELAVPVDLDLIAGALGSAYAFRRGDFAFGPCLEAEFGALRAQSVGDRSVDRPGWGPWASLWLGALLEYEIRARVGLGLSALGGVPLRRPTFGVQGGTAVEETEPFDIRVYLGMRILLGAKKTLASGQ